MKKKKKKGMHHMKHMHLWDFHMPFKFGHMKYASRIGRSFPKILNWTGIATPKYTEIQSLFVASNVSDILIFAYTCFLIYITMFLLLITFFLS